MSRIGKGYGSEWHLLWYLGRHRAELSQKIRRETGCQDVDWLDFPSRQRDGALLDAEWKGLDFLADPAVIMAWREFWPQGAGIQNWDGVAKLQMDGRDEWLLVEAKGHCGEAESSCAAKPEGGLDKIRQALEATKRSLGVDASRDWLNGYYQYCNRVSILHFLETHGVAARLLFVYFTGDTTAGRECPKNESGWRGALDGQDAHVGLPTAHPLAARIHKLFLPVFANIKAESRDDAR